VRDIMNATALDAELNVWQADDCAVRIAYSRAVMEELSLAATDGFNRLAHGGVEIGGVLFGVRDPDAVKILAHRALACEYAFGPSWMLSDNDRCALEDLLASPNTDSNLSGMQPVGWYISHTRSEIVLSERDLQLFQQYFPELWQIALVLRPHRFDPVRAGFFFRDPDGSMQAAFSQHEFVIEPGGSKPGMHLPGDRAPADTAPAAADPRVSEPALLERDPRPSAISHNPRSGPEPRPSAAPRVASSSSLRRWAWNAAAIAVALAGVLFWIGRSRDSAGLSLRELDAGRQLRIDWDHNSRVIQQSERGALEIEDGSLKLHNELSPDFLRTGSVTYLRTSGNVLVRLVVRGAGQSTLTEIRRFLGPPVAKAAPIYAGSANRSAKNDGTDAAPVRREREQEVQHGEPVEDPSNRTPRDVRVQSEIARQTSAASAPERRRLVLPPASVPRLAEPLLPAPPVIEANTAAAMATFPTRLTAPAPLNPADQGPSAGTVIWTGKLAKSGTLQIFGDRASQGHITGGLPGAPVRVQVFPSELTQEGLRIFTADPGSVSAPEAPGAQNGWNRTVYVLNPRRAGEISILETPRQQNAWNRLILRAERGDHSIIVLRWERVPAESALHAAGNR